MTKTKGLLLSNCTNFEYFKGNFYFTLYKPRSVWYNIDAAEKMYRLLRLRVYKLCFGASEGAQG